MKNAAGNMKYLWVMYRNGGNGWFYYVMEADEFDWNTHRTFAFADNDNDGLYRRSGYQPLLFFILL